MKKWIIYSVERCYEVEGDEADAETERRHQAQRHGAVFHKAEDTPENRTEMASWKARHRSAS